MKRTIYCILFLLLAIAVNAQQHYDDSLRAVLKTEKDDTNKIINLAVLSWDLTNVGGNHEADSMARLALSMSEKINYDRGIYKAYNSLGGVCWALTDYPGAMINFNKSLDAAKRMNNKLNIANCLSHIGSIFHLEGNLPEALKNNLASLDIYEQAGDEDGKSKMYNNIGNVYAEEHNEDEAMRYYKMSRDISLKRNDKYGLEGACMNMGIGYILRHKYDSALAVLNQCLAVGIEIGDKFDVGEAYLNLGYVQQVMGKPDEALATMFKSLNSHRQIDNKRGICTAYASIGELYFDSKEYPLAAKYLDSALAVAKTIGAKILTATAYKDYASLDSATGNYKMAFSDYKNYVIYNDSVNNEAGAKKIVQEQMQYDFDKKEAVQKAEQNKKDALAASDRKRQQVIMGSVTIGLLLVLIFAGLLFNRFRIIKKQKEIIEVKNKETEEQKRLIEEQKAIVEEKNKDITDSIHYASRIQRALLTTEEYIGRRAKEYFILFKPRDIVSGDFYWANEVDTPGGKKFLICAGDCTGHGIPGAFMSLLNISLLNEVNIERKINSPEKILDRVREQIIKALNADGDEKGSKDGMDCVLCSFDFQHNSLEVACANNPVWIVPSGETEFIEIRPDKMPVGMQGEKNEPFTLQAVPLTKGDMVYLFTDGYADQFGGPKGKKFKYKALSEKLKMISAKSMVEQKNMLEQTIEEWKGGLEQVDDILIIGIRV